jgi:hypothetical protein
VSKSHPEFDCMLFKIMEMPCKKQNHLSDEELLKLLYNHEPSGILESVFHNDNHMKWTCWQLVNKEQILMLKRVQMATVTCKTILGLEYTLRDCVLLLVENLAHMLI